MKNFTTITEKMVCNGQTYKVMQFTAETEAEKKFGDRPWIAVHSGYTEADLPLTGLQLLLSKDYHELTRRMKIDAAVRTFKEQNPDADDIALAMYLDDLKV